MSWSCVTMAQQTKPHQRLDRGVPGNEVIQGMFFASRGPELLAR
jgi:hypothetical protein